MHQERQNCGPSQAVDTPGWAGWGGRENHGEPGRPGKGYLIADCNVHALERRDFKGRRNFKTPLRLVCFGHFRGCALEMRLWSRRMKSSKTSNNFELRQWFRRLDGVLGFGV
jgi:hypothetical protein